MHMPYHHMPRQYEVGSFIHTIHHDHSIIHHTLPGLYALCSRPRRMERPPSPLNPGYDTFREASSPSRRDAGTYGVWCDGYGMYENPVTKDGTTLHFAYHCHTPYTHTPLNHYIPLNYHIPTHLINTTTYTITYTTIHTITYPE